MIETTSFFFKNFPDQCNMETLRDKFMTVGKVVDIFCPKKKDKEGKRFGFVRFAPGFAKERVLEDLNNIWISSYKLRVFFPKFERNHSVAKGGNQNQNHFAANSGVRVTSKSHADKFTGGQRTDKTEDGVPIQIKESVVRFSTTEEERSWLKDCWTGLLKEDFSWHSHIEELLSECGGYVRIRYIGDNVVIMHNNSAKPLKEMIEGLDEWFSYWFEWCRP